MHRVDIDAALVIGENIVVQRLLEKFVRRYTQSSSRFERYDQPGFRDRAGRTDRTQGYAASGTILASRAFRQADRLKRFLRFIFDETLA